jgi:hypothetical protein
VAGVRVGAAVPQSIRLPILPLWMRRQPPDGVPLAAERGAAVVVEDAPLRRMLLLPHRKVP